MSETVFQNYPIHYTEAHSNRSIYNIRIMIQKDSKITGNISVSSLV